MSEITFSTECPEIYKRLEVAFDVNWDEGLIIAYNPTIYCKFRVTPEKIVHESVHIKRQDEIGVDLWYDMYIANPSYRLEEEVLAYKAEYKFLKKYVKDRELLFRLKRDMAHNLSSPVYGNLVGLDEALKLIG